MAGSDEISVNLDSDLEELVSAKKLDAMAAVQLQTLRDLQAFSALVIEDDSKKNVTIRIRARKKSSGD